MSYTGVDGELREQIKHYVACGFEDPRVLRERICEIFSDADKDEVSGLVDKAFAARDEEAAAWPEVTDCDRLDRAFEVLETAGIVARHNFACCQNCGRYEIVNEIADVRSARRRVEGFVFYHLQDADSAVTNGVLHLRYDGTYGNDALAIGTRIVAALRDAGLAAKWNGDPTKTIEVALRWQRRAAPRAPELTRSAASCVATWCAALPVATLSAAAANAGADFPIALDAAGLHAEAMAWARAPFDDADRACALARLAVVRRSPELLVEAWKLAPWDDHTFVTLLCEAGLDNPQVRAIACAKIQEMRRDAYGSAASAWLYAYAPDLESARDRARHEWSSQRKHAPEAALLALAAGLWRAGDASLREPTLSKLTSAVCLMVAVDAEWARVTAITAAATAEDVLAIAGEIHMGLAPDRIRYRALARLVELGAVDAARAFVKGPSVAYVAYVMWRTSDVAALETIAAELDEYALQCDEGLISKTELRDLRIAVAAGTAASQPTRARALLTGIAATACADALAEERDAAIAQLAGRAVDPDPGEQNNSYNPTLKAAIAQWAKAVPIRRRFDKRHASRAMLAHAAAHARRGEVERARELVALVLAPLSVEDELYNAIQHAGIEDHIVAAWVALGDLARVDQFTRDALSVWCPLSCATIGCYVPALLAAGERERGLALLGAALAAGDRAVKRADTRRALLELIPAVLAAAGDAAGQVHAAWRIADEALASLALLPATIA